MRDAGTMNRSLTLANKAVSIDPADAQAHLCRGWACMHLREWTHAQVSFDLALRCNQDDPWAVISVALAAAFRGEHRRATELSDRFLDEGWTNSAINWGYLANIRFLAGDFHGSVAAAESAGAASLNIPAWHAAALAHLGQTEAAAAQWQVFEDLVRPQWPGSVPASTSAIREWLLSGFPIRRDAERLALADGVDAAIAHLGDRHAHCAQV
jgi:Flp pilus assembly protein TadD